jgi:3-isopropylmalate/(R)-2-methylmalate dehydratase small subunit
MEDIDADFQKKINRGDIIVAGKNFGCGSSREHAPIAIKASGISCVIASTFARIFYRNSINMALPILECAEAAEKISDGDEIEIDFDSGVITNITKNESYGSQTFPEFIKNIINGDGLLKSIINN